MGGDDRAGGDRLGTVLVGLQRSPPIQRPVRTDGVVVAGESVELTLQTGHGVSGRLRGQPFLDRLVEAFDAPMFVKPLWGWLVGMAWPLLGV